MMTRQQFQDLLRKYREGMCSPEERKFVDDWFAAISTEKKRFTENEVTDFLRERSWVKVDQHIRRRQRPGPSPGSTRLLRWSLIGVAATLLVSLGVGWHVITKDTAEQQLPSVLRETYADRNAITNDGFEEKELILPDKSRIHLLPGSRVRFSRMSGSEKREVFLEGEAFFEVMPDKSRPFLVYTQDITTEVLGTSFLIKAHKQQNKVVVAVKTGKVSVYTNMARDTGSPKRHQKVILSPNEQVVYNINEQITLKKLVGEPQVILPAPTLKDSYTNAPVIEILTSLEENYGIDIRYDADLLSNCTLTSDMSNEGFYEQIGIICNALGARYKVEETVIIIEAAGCNNR